jgi:hypothetical protein
MSNTESDPLASTQAVLPVSLIATPRAALFTCAPSEKVCDVITRHSDYDHIPVTQDGTPQSRVLGMLDVHRYRDSNSTVTVSDLYGTLCEEHLIGADAPIIEFILDAGERDCRLLVSGKSISGLVTLSDLQSLPVRAALFALVTRLEIVMTEWIKREFSQDGDAWLKRLSEGRRERVRAEIRAAKRSDTFVDELLCTYFGDKVGIVGKSPSLPGNRKEFASAMSAAIKLRNAVAHAHNYASSRASALQVCSTVGRITSWIDALGIASSTEALGRDT